MSASPPPVPGDPGSPPALPRPVPARPPRRPPARTRLRNRRYGALRELIRGGEYFSEQQMRLRAPALFHHYIGRFRDPHPGPSPPGGSPNPPGFPPGAPALRELLLSALEGPPAEEEEEEDEDEDEEDEEEGAGRVPDAAERELLRLEFTSRMHQRFLEGLDQDFDYSQVDGNAELEALDEEGRDREERYFDQEEPGPAPPLD